MTEKMKHLKRDSIARTVCLLLALFNQVLAVIGKESLPILEEDVYQLITLCLTMGTAMVAWWKNNSFTRGALASDQLMHTIKKQDAERKKNANWD